MNLSKVNTTFMIRVELLGGIRPERAIRDGIDLARRLKNSIVFNHTALDNVSFVITPDDKYDETWARFRDLWEQKNQARFEDSYFAQDG